VPGGEEADELMNLREDELQYRFSLFGCLIVMYLYKKPSI
jgi:hypothetical protein